MDFDLEGLVEDEGCVRCVDDGFGGDEGAFAFPLRLFWGVRRLRCQRGTVQITCQAAPLCDCRVGTLTVRARAATKTRRAGRRPRLQSRGRGRQTSRPPSRSIITCRGCSGQASSFFAWELISTSIRAAHFVCLTSTNLAPSRSGRHHSTSTGPCPPHSLTPPLRDPE